MAEMSRSDLFLRIKQHLKDKESKELRTYVESEELLPAGEIEHLNPQEIFVKLEHKMKLPRGDLSLLVDLMTKIGRDDFAKEAETVAAQEKEEKRSAKRSRSPLASPASSPERKVRRKSEELSVLSADEKSGPRERLQTNSASAEAPVTGATRSSLSTGPVLPAHLHLGLGQAEDISKEEIMEQIVELERTLFTAEVKKDPKLYLKMLRVFLPHAGILVNLLSGSVILLLTFLRQTDVDRFYHNHYRVGEGTLSQQLSHILISDDLQDKVRGAQLIVRLHVKHEDYVRVRNRLRQGLDRTTSVDNLRVLPSPSRHVGHSSLLSALDLAVIGREDQSCTGGTEDIPALNFTARQVQTAMHTGKQRSQQQVRRLEGEHREQMHSVRVQMRTAKEQTDAIVHSQTKEITRLKEKEEKAQKILLEQKEENQKLSEANKSMAATIEEQMYALQTAKPKGSNQGVDPGNKEDPEKDPEKDPWKKEDSGKDPGKKEDPGKDPGKKEDS